MFDCAKRFRLLGKLDLFDPLNNLSILADQQFRFQTATARYRAFPRRLP